MFGRIAAGLVHDLSHPIQNIGNSCKLIMKMWDARVPRHVPPDGRPRDGDRQARARRPPQHRASDSAGAFPMDVNRAVADAVETMQQHAETAGLTLRAELSDDPLFMEGDVFALGRVYRNLILNAIQATAPGGLVVAASGGARRSRAGARLRHGLRDPGGSVERDLRGLRDDQASRPRPRPGDLPEDRGAARRHDQRGQRGRQGHDVRARVPTHRGAAHCAGRRVIRLPRASGSALGRGL